MPDGKPPKLYAEIGENPTNTPRFQGEWMRCKGCGIAQKSNKNQESNWTFIQIDDTGFYVCPKCFGNGRFKDHIRDLMTGR